MTEHSFFAGANTARGFYSYYNYLALDSHKRVFILKGGPGTGKSTLLKRVADMMKADYDVDRFHCSADVSSLDGVYIHGLDVSLLDGTAPHVIDPRLPGAVQQIVDLGTCWEPLGLMEKRDRIQELSDVISSKYRVAYKWLAVAAGQAELIQDLERKKDQEKQAISDGLTIAGFLPPAASGKNRRAFASAITGNGLMNFLPNLQEDSHNNIYLVGGNRSYNTIVLNRIQKELTDRNIPATYLYCGLQPQYLEHIYIPGRFGLYSHHRPHFLNLGDKVFGGPAEETGSQLEQAMFGTIEAAIGTLSQARALHMELEKIYIPQVDYRAVENLQKKIIDSIAHLKS